MFTYELFVSCAQARYGFGGKLIAGNIIAFQVVDQRLTSSGASYVFPTTNVLQLLAFCSSSLRHCPSDHRELAFPLAAPHYLTHMWLRI